MTGSPDRTLARVLTLTLFGYGCATSYPLLPAPRAGDGVAPVKAQVRNVSWSGQPEAGELAAGARLVAELDVHNADAARPHDVGALRLVVHAALDRPAVLVLPQLSDDEFEPSAPPLGRFAPRETRTVSAAFEVPEAVSPRGAAQLVLVVPVEGERPLEVVLAEPAGGGPRWAAPAPAIGVYVASGATLLPGSNALTVLEPLGVSVRASRGAWVLALSETAGYVYQEALAGGPPGYGFSTTAQLLYEPWTTGVAPYVEGGVLLGAQRAPSGYDTPSKFLALPRAGAGLLFAWGARLGVAGALPFERPRSPQRRWGVRLGYARWFNLGSDVGANGVELALEAGAPW